MTIDTKLLITQIETDIKICKIIISYGQNPVKFLKNCSDYDLKLIAFHLNNYYYQGEKRPTNRCALIDFIDSSMKKYDYLFHKDMLIEMVRKNVCALHKINLASKSANELDKKLDENLKAEFPDKRTTKTLNFKFLLTFKHAELKKKIAIISDFLKEKRASKEDFAYWNDVLLLFLNDDDLNIFPSDHPLSIDKRDINVTLEEIYNFYIKPNAKGLINKHLGMLEEQRGLLLNEYTAFKEDVKAHELETLFTEYYSTLDFFACLIKLKNKTTNASVPELNNFFDLARRAPKDLALHFDEEQIRLVPAIGNEIAGINLSELKITDLDFSNKTLKSVNFKGAKLKNINVKNAILIDVTIDKEYLTELLYIDTAKLSSELTLQIDELFRSSTDLKKLPKTTDLMFIEEYLVFLESIKDKANLPESSKADQEEFMAQYNALSELVDLYFKAYLERQNSSDKNQPKFWIIDEAKKTLEGTGPNLAQLLTKNDKSLILRGFISEVEQALLETNKKRAYEQFLELKPKYAAAIKNGDYDLCQKILAPLVLLRNSDLILFAKTYTKQLNELKAALEKKNLTKEFAADLQILHQLQLASIEECFTSTCESPQKIAASNVLKLFELHGKLLDETLDHHKIFSTIFKPLHPEIILPKKIIVEKSIPQSPAEPQVWYLEIWTKLKALCHKLKILLKEWVAALKEFFTPKREDNTIPPQEIIDELLVAGRINFIPSKDYLKQPITKKVISEDNLLDNFRNQVENSFVVKNPVVSFLKKRSFLT